MPIKPAQKRIRLESLRCYQGNSSLSQLKNFVLFYKLNESWTIQDFARVLPFVELGARNVESLAAELIARVCAAQIAGPQIYTEALIHGRFGKPSFASAPDLHFNISHSKGRILVGFSEGPLGLDIERFREVDEQLIGRCLNEQQQAELGEHRSQDFLRLWSQKEAYLKYDGRGLCAPFAELDLSQPDIAALLTSFDSDSCAIALCSKRDDFSFLELDEETFARWMRI